MTVNPFPVANVPFGIISTEKNTLPRPATLIDDTVVDLASLEVLGAFDHIEAVKSAKPFQSSYLNNFAALDKAARSAVRAHIQKLWTEGTLHKTYSAALLPARSVHNHVPMHTINYADYVSSRGHFENIQNLMNTPLPARSPFYHMPTGYYGNSRNIVVSGTPVYRFWGLIADQFQTEKPATAGPSQKFDYELELGVYLCGGKPYGEPIRVEEADDYVFGFVLLNDWSGRDIQRAESGGPTGPFLAKSGCVTISPWIVTLEAVAAARRPRQQPAVVPFVAHLSEDASTLDPCLVIRCSAFWKGPESKDNKGSESSENFKGIQTSHADYSDTYWTYRQLLAHQTANGSMVGAGDLLGTGTMSMYQSDDMGRCCVSERTYNGSKPVDIGNGQTRAWIEDGDEITFEGWVYDGQTGEQLFGFGECRGVVHPAQFGAAKI
ncbi:hypothetical protein SBRCBS47491_002664 [Sporothrix bragantina]|uniref:Fumarylacetoacetase n=1 Tax=Sporothrix bragantina TaxID=671064 RepID=A0ABP0B9Q7_9PEZI